MNSDIDKFLSFVVGVLVGLLLLVYSHSEDADKIDACEAKLPRDQHCTLIAVPKEPAE